MKTETSKGLDFGTLSRTAYAVFHGAAGQAGDFEGLSEVQQTAWNRLAMHAIGLLDRDDGPDSTFPALADEMYWAWACVAKPVGPNEPREPFDKLPLTERLCWEAVGRHLAGVCDPEDPVDIATGEATFHGWASKHFDKRAQAEARN